MFIANINLIHDNKNWKIDLKTEQNRTQAYIPTTPSRHHNHQHESTNQPIQQQFFKIFIDTLEWYGMVFFLNK